MLDLDDMERRMNEDDKLLGAVLESRKLELGGVWVNTPVGTLTWGTIRRALRTHLSASVSAQRRKIESVKKLRATLAAKKLKQQET
jgi:hypothetical protein